MSEPSRQVLRAVDRAALKVRLRAAQDRRRQALKASHRLAHQRRAAALPALNERLENERRANVRRVAAKRAEKAAENG